MQARMAGSIQQGRRYLDQLASARAFGRPVSLIEPYHLLLDQKEQLLERSIEARLEERRQTLAKDAARLEALSPLAVLSRGYAAVSDREGHALTRAEGIHIEDTITIRFSDGLVSAEVTSVKGMKDDEESNEL